MKAHFINLKAILALTVSVLLSIFSHSFAATYTWTSTTTGAQSWTTAGNWLGGTQYLSDASNELIFFSDSSTNIAAMTQTFTNVPATLSMNTLTLNGKGASSGASSSNVTIGSSASTWTIGDGTTSTVNLNANFGATAAAGFNTTVAANLTLNQAVTTFTGNGTGGFTFSGNITDGVNDYGITKSGNSTLVLSGTGNTYSGITTLSAGVLQGNMAASATPTSSFGTSALQLNGGTLNLRSNGAGSSGTITVGNNVTVGNSMTISVDRVSANTGNTIALGTLSIGAQTLTVTGANTYALSFGATTLTGNAVFNADTANLLLSAAIGDGVSDFGFTKTGAGVLTLSGTNTYSGATRINAGTLSVSAAANLGDSSANLIFNGGTLRITGTALNSLSGLGRTIQFTSGQTVGLDIADASNTFSVNTVLNQGRGGLTKSGAGTLAIGLHHTYTGTTTISAGTLRLDEGGVVLGAILNNSNFTVNSAGSVSQGTHFGLIGGTGSLTQAGAGALTLNRPNIHTGDTRINAGTLVLGNTLALQNSAYDTASINGGLVLTGFTTPILGGITGSVELSSSLITGYGDITNLTLNPQSGITKTYTGNIANGAAGMTLTKTGAGTQVLQGTNTFSGATAIKNGTLSLSGTAGALSNTSGLTLSGGGLTLTSADSLAEDDFDRVNDSAPITSNGGTITYTTTTAASTKAFIETLGTLDLVMGQLNLVNTLDKSAGSQTLALSGLTRSGAANTSAITYSNAGGLNLTNDRIRVNGITADTAAGQIIGAWATVGTAANAQTDYAMYDSDGINGFVVARNIGGTAETTWTTATNAYTMSSNQTLTATRTITALRSATGAGGTLTLATGANLETYGLLSGAQTLAVNVGTGGVLTTPSGGGNLYITTGGNTISITAPINDNGGAVTLVKSGASTLTLGGTSNYTGGTVINGGTLSTTADNQLGASGGIIVNGTSQWTMGAATTVTYARSLTINEGAVLTLSSGNASKTVTGVLSGNGSIIGAATTGYIFSNTNNTFTGTVSNGYQMLFASIGDSSNAINLVGSNSEFQWTGGAKAFALRPLTLNAAGTGNFNNNGTGAVTFAQDLAFSGAAGARTLALGGTYTGGTNVFSGNVTDAPGSAVSLTKNGAGAWRVTGNLSNTGGVNINQGGVLTLTGTNTYYGNTTFAGNGTFLTLAGLQAASPNTFYNMNTGASSSTTTIKFLDDTNNVNGSTTTFPGTFRNNSNNTPGASTNFIVGNNNTANGGTGSGTTTGSTIAIGTLDWGSEASGTVNYGPINIQGTNGYRMYISNVRLYKATNVTSGTVGNTFFVPTTANVTIGDVTMDTGNTGQGYQTFVMDGTSLDNQVIGTISNASDFATSNRELRVTKSNTSNWTLFGNNTYTGATTVSGGVLNVSDLANGGSNSNIGASSNAAANLILNGGTLRYVGPGTSTDRLFSLQTSSTIDASGYLAGVSDDATAIDFTNPGSMGFNGGTAAKTLTLTGTNTGDNTIASVIGDLTGATAITKTGIGTWVLSATNTNTGATGLSGGGNLVLDYGTNDTNKIAGVLSLGGGTLTAKGATGSHVEVVTSTSLNAGGTFLTRDGANTAKFRMNAITRAAGGTISFESATLADTDTNNVNSILGGWATLGNDWAVSANSGAADTAVTALGSYTTWVNSTGSATANYLLNGNGSIVTTGVAANTVKISNSSNSETLALNNLNLTITSASATSLGGIMYTGGSDGLYSITGGTGRIQTSTANQELIFAVQTGTLSVDAFVGASGSSGPVTKSGIGTLSISSANNYTGATRVNQGVLRLANATAAGTTAGGITVQNGAALEIANNISIGAEALSLTGAGVYNVSESQAEGALRNIASNTSSYAGAISLGAGGARINSDANGVLTLTGGVVTSLFNDVTFGGAGNTTVSTTAISGAGGLIKDGAGITTLTATNTYTGATRVTNGILSIGTVASPTGSINSSALTIDGGNFRYNSSTNYTGALTFTSGTISGTNWGGSLSNLTIGVDDTVSPGNSPGTAVTGNQTWASGGTYVWEINSTLGSAGADPGWDLINGSGELAITASTELVFNIDVTSLTTGNLAGQVSDFDQSLNYNWLIADFASVLGFSADRFAVNTDSFANTFTGSFAVALGDSGTIGGDNTQIWLTYTAIPEPKAALLGGLGLLLLLRRRR